MGLLGEVHCRQGKDIPETTPAFFYPPPHYPPLFSGICFNTQEQWGGMFVVPVPPVSLVPLVSPPVYLVPPVLLFPLFFLFLLSSVQPLNDKPPLQKGGLGDR